jgi:hypothetical protein
MVPKRENKNVKKLILTLTIAFISIATTQADYFRVFYYVAKEDGYYGADGKRATSAGSGRPFKYTATAKTQCEVYCELIKEEPKAVDVSIHHMDIE